MGYYKHYVIIVTTYTEKDADTAREKALEIFGEAGEIHVSNVNYFCTFMVPPSGSKLGWPEAEKAAENRRLFINWLKKDKRYDFIEVVYGGDDDSARVLNKRR